MSGRTKQLPGIKDAESIDEIGDALLEFKKTGKQALACRKKLGDIKEKVDELMAKHGKKVYVDEETGYRVTRGSTPVITIEKLKAPKEEKKPSKAERAEQAAADGE